MRTRVNSGGEKRAGAWEARVIAIIRRPQSAQFYRVFGGKGKGVVLDAGSETGVAGWGAMASRGVVAIVDPGAAIQRLSYEGHGNRFRADVALHEIGTCAQIRALGGFKMGGDNSSVDSR